MRCSRATSSRRRTKIARPHLQRNPAGYHSTSEGRCSNNRSQLSGFCSGVPKRSASCITAHYGVCLVMHSGKVITRLAARPQQGGAEQPAQHNKIPNCPPIERRIKHAAFAALGIPFRPAILAGVSRTIVNPATFNTVRDETIRRGRRAFDRLYGKAGLTLERQRKAIKCENICRRYSHVRWVFRQEVRYSQAKMAPDKLNQNSDDPCRLTRIFIRRSCAYF